MAFVEDLTPYFADFGDAGTLDGVAVRVIFDAAVQGQLGGVGMLAAQPQVQIASASVPASPEGKALVIPQGSYIVREHLPDGTGLSVLTLTKA